MHVGKGQHPPVMTPDTAMIWKVHKPITIAEKLVQIMDTKHKSEV